MGGMSDEVWVDGRTDVNTCTYVWDGMGMGMGSAKAKAK